MTESQCENLPIESQSENFNKSIENENLISPIVENKDHDATENNMFRFNPPLYVQRYDYLTNILEKNNCTTYLDIGCAECKLLQFLKNNSNKLNLIIGIDCQSEVLRHGNEKLASSWFDHIKPRENPLEVYLIQGDISMPSNHFIEQISQQSIDLDCVSMIEIIEHMLPDTLENSMETVLNKIKPKIVLITTPNSDYNVVFNDLDTNKDKSDNKPKFRHWDHKFEWSRKEFQVWCENILIKYSDYELVCYDGVGEAPKNYNDIGYCSQIVLLKRKEISQGLDQIENNKFQAFLNDKIKLNWENRWRRQRGEENINTEPYFNKKKFELENYDIENEENKYDLHNYIQYPFEMFVFESVEARNKAIYDEVDYLLYFITKNSSRSKLYDEFYNTLSSEVESILKKDQDERLENGIDIEDETIRLCSVEKLVKLFTNLEKFKVSTEDLIEILQGQDTDYEFTLNKKFIIVREYDEEEDVGSFKSHDYGNFDNYPSPEKNFDQDVEVDFDGEENWDDEIISPFKPVLPKRIYTPEEQFSDDPIDSNLISISSVINTVNNITDSFSSKCSSLSGSNLNDDESLEENFEINYYSDKSKELEVKFRKMREQINKEQRRINREERRRIRRELRGEYVDLNNEQFEFIF